MRFSSFVVSLALILSISSVTAQTIMAGTWTSSYTSTSTSNYCCVPDSIRISCSSSSSSICTATYNYPYNLNSKCYSLFLSASSGSMTLSKSSSNYYTEYFTSTNSNFGWMTWNYVASNSTGNPSLSISGTSSMYSGSCSFTMSSRVAPPTSDGGIGGLVVFLIIIFLCCGAGGAKQYQKRQATVIIAQNLAQPVVTVQQPTPIIVQQPAPVLTVHQQGFIQPQTTYVAPNQFPNTQVNMNFQAQQFPNTQVNMGFQQQQPQRF